MGGEKRSTHILGCTQSVPFGLCWKTCTVCTESDIVCRLARGGDGLFGRKAQSLACVKLSLVTGTIGTPLFQDTCVCLSVLPPCMKLSLVTGTIDTPLFQDNCVCLSVLPPQAIYFHRHPTIQRIQQRFTSFHGRGTATFVSVLRLVSWCFEPSQPQRITSGLISVRETVPEKLP